MAARWALLGGGQWVLYVRRLQLHLWGWYVVEISCSNEGSWQAGQEAATSGTLPT